MQKLTGKEEEVMELIWQLGECAPKDLVACYDEPRPHVNTIATMVQSLERKGFVGHRPQGRGYIYFPLVKQEEYGRSKLGGFVDRYFKHSYIELVSSLVQDEKVSEQELLDFLNELKRK
ncbi:MAG: BlaI/MecI/CopY family transcriptional regulator [Prevotella sp.]|nr:BlaI/MecI/CopY family transcriptional regulator [Prevotella sp.]